MEDVFMMEVASKLGLRSLDVIEQGRDCMSWAGRTYIRGRPDVCRGR